MSTSRRLFKGTFYFGLGNFLPKVINFFLIPLYTMYLLPMEYGLADLALTLSAFTIYFVRLGVPGAVTRFYFDYRNDQNLLNDYITSMFWSMLSISLINGSIILLILFFYSETLIPDLPFLPFIPLVLTTSIINSASDIQRRLMQVREEFKRTAVLNLVVVLTTIGLTVLLVIGLEMGALGIILSSAFSAILFFVYALYYLWPNLKGNFSLALLKPSLKYAMGIFPYHIALSITPLVSKSLLSSQSGLAAVGVLAISLRLFSPLSIIINAVNSALTPIYYSEREKDTFINQLIPTLKNTWYLAFTLFMVLVALGPEVIFLLVAEEYHESSKVFPILSFVFLINLFGMIPNMEIYYHKKTRLIAYSSISGVIFELGFIYLTLRHLGYYSLAIGFCINPIVKLILNSIFVGSTFWKEQFKIGWRWVFRALTVVLAVAILDMLSLYLLDLNIGIQILLSILLVLIGITSIYFLDPYYKVLAIVKDFISTKANK